MHHGLPSCLYVNNLENCSADGAVIPSCKVADTAGIPVTEVWAPAIDDCVLK